MQIQTAASERDYPSGHKHRRPGPDSYTAELPGQAVAGAVEVQGEQEARESCSACGLSAALAHVVVAAHTH